MTTTSKKALTFGLLAGALALSAPVPVQAAEADTRLTRATVAKQLGQVRQATAKYHNVDAALADGYRPTGHCEESPDGAMGIHYLNPARLGELDPLRPAVLLYLPTHQGQRLIGVEYFHVDADQDLTTDDDVPSLFGQTFNGPMVGHEPGMPIHDDLHVWVWAHNPAGMFAQWNPALSC